MTCRETVNSDHSDDGELILFLTQHECVAMANAQYYHGDKDWYKPEDYYSLFFLMIIHTILGYRKAKFVRVKQKQKEPSCVIY